MEDPSGSSRQGTLSTEAGSQIVQKNPRQVKDGQQHKDTSDWLLAMESLRSANQGGK